MPILPAALLAIALAAVAWLSRRNVAEYAAFKRLTDTKDRQARYRRWLLGGFALFVGGSLAILALLGELGGVIRPPQALAGPVRWAQSLRAPAVEPVLLGGLVAGVVIGVVAATLLATVVARRRVAAPNTRTPKTRTLGDIQPLMPRNAAETAWTGLLSINAGIGEELFFRLTLPLLIALVTGSAPTAFVAAAIVFGLAHVYQGWVGVAATTVVGFVFTGVYLWTGNLAVPMALHAGLDLLALVVRPTLARAQARRSAAQRAVRRRSGARDAGP